MPLPGREVKVKIWRIQVGRVPLYLLDCNIPENSAEDRNITAQLYGGDKENAHQAGDRPRHRRRPGAAALGKEPTVCH